MILFGCSNSPSKQHPLRNATLQIIVRFFDWNGSEVYSVYIYNIYYIYPGKQRFLHSFRTNRHQYHSFYQSKTRCPLTKSQSILSRLDSLLSWKVSWWEWLQHLRVHYTVSFFAELGGDCLQWQRQEKFLPQFEESTRVNMKEFY